VTIIFKFIVLNLHDVQNLAFQSEMDCDRWDKKLKSMALDLEKNLNTEYGSQNKK
jgi:hypothetical protein